MTIFEFVHDVVESRKVMGSDGAANNLDIINYTKYAKKNCIQTNKFHMSINRLYFYKSLTINI